jgi:hypothetical protein
MCSPSLKSSSRPVAAQYNQQRNIVDSALVFLYAEFYYFLCGRTGAGIIFEPGKFLELASLLDGIIISFGDLSSPVNDICIADLQGHINIIVQRDFSKIRLPDR